MRLASGNAGVQAATNEVLETTELPMMLYVYLTIVALVFLTYRDWRAMVACCLPLTLATFLGYWFMKELDIGLTVATLPVMVLAVGIGVDYAFYIYNRLQLYLAEGMDIVTAFKQALRETGIATIFTAITLSVGVATWVVLAAQVPGRHGPAARLHVHGQHADGDHGAAGAGGDARRADPAAAAGARAAPESLTGHTPCSNKLLATCSSTTAPPDGRHASAPRSSAASSRSPRC